MDKRTLKVRIYGDSLSIPRPGLVEPQERYFSILLDWWRKQESVEYIDLLERSKASTTVLSASEFFRHDLAYYGKEMDVLILHFGICDCAPRPVPRWVRDKISTLPEFFKNIVVKFIHTNRSRMQKSGMVWRVVEPKPFKASLSAILKDAVPNAGRIYLINIAPTTETIEKHSPGFQKSISLYNDILHKVVESFQADNLYLIDGYSIIEDQPEKKDLYITKEDGHHLTALTHRIFSEEILKIEARFFKNEPFPVSIDPPNTQLPLFITEGSM